MYALEKIHPVVSRIGWALYIIGAILYFDYEQKSEADRKKVKDEIKEAVKTALGTDDKKELDETYEIKDSDSEETIRPIITKYLYRKELGYTGDKLIKTKAKEEKKDFLKTPEKETKEASWKDWFVFRKGNIGKPLTTYIGGLILILAVVGAIFWKSIVEWWNGPAEEGGEMEGVEEDKENE